MMDGMTDDQTTAPTCPRCGSPRWVSVSLDGGWTRRAQCVPCGAYHPGSIGPGWQSPRAADPEAVAPAYRPELLDVSRPGGPPETVPGLPRRP